VKSRGGEEKVGRVGERTRRENEIWEHRRYWHIYSQWYVDLVTLIFDLKTVSQVTSDMGKIHAHYWLS